ncbi:hypothetical protein MMC10_002389 [Thelotrema lepadinum]|nr:hypothetical protein [Thelotrema lepadinum]
MPPKATDHTNMLELCRQHAYSIWLLTVSDLKSIVWPETAFGLFSALSGSQMTTNTSPSLREILLRLPQVVLWNWLNVFIFDLANQRLEDSIVEDRVNKPWRPIPSGRLTALHATNLLLFSIPAIVLITWYLGGMEECVAMIVLTWMYNDLGGADQHYITQNVINAFGFVCYSSDSTKVAAGHGKWDISQRGLVWLSLIWLIIFSTLQVQDMADVKGDAARGRKTLPLVQGQLTGRLSIAIPVLIFSAICLGSGKFLKGVTSYRSVLA